jgi:hypothetical protein
MIMSYTMWLPHNLYEGEHANYIHLIYELANFLVHMYFDSWIV